MKLKHGILMLALGFCLGFAGSMMKIMHTKYATELLWIATVFKILGVLFISSKLITNPKLKDLMNS